MLNIYLHKCNFWQFFQCSMSTKEKENQTEENKHERVITKREMPMNICYLFEIDKTVHIQTKNKQETNDCTCQIDKVQID